MRQHCVTNVIKEKFFCKVSFIFQFWNPTHDEYLLFKENIIHAHDTILIHSARKFLCALGEF